MHVAHIVVVAMSMHVMNCITVIIAYRHYCVIVLLYYSFADCDLMQQEDSVLDASEHVLGLFDI